MEHSSTPGIDIIMARYLAREATDEETVILLRWIEASDENRKEFFACRDLWISLHPVFGDDSIDIDAAEQRVSARIKRMEKTLRRRWPMTAKVCVAACLAVGLFVAGGILMPSVVPAHTPVYTIATTYGCTLETILPDSTKVWLNANSTLSYPARFSDARREVELSGEAFFDVRADPNHPFDVKAGEMTVTATGTEFNVNAYTSSEISAVTLVEGRVDVQVGLDTYAMSESEHLYFDGHNVKTRYGVKTEKYCSWRKGVLIFDDDPLVSICQRLEQLHNVEFEIAPEVADENFHIILRGEGLGDVLDMLAMCAPISYTIEENSDSVGDETLQHVYISAKQP